MMLCDLCSEEEATGLLLFGVLSSGVENPRV